MTETDSTELAALREAEELAFRAIMSTNGLYIPNDEDWHLINEFREAVAARVRGQLLEQIAAAFRAGFQAAAPSYDIEWEQGEWLDYQETWIRRDALAAPRPDAGDGTGEP